MKIRTANNAERICALLIEGYTLRQIARELGFRSASAIVNWANEDATFRERYARAMELRCERMAEEILEISDNGSNDWMEREGLIVPDHENVQRSRLRVDSRKWLLSKMMPKKYGDRVTTEVTGDPNAPLLTRIELVAVAPKSQPEDLPASNGSDEATVTPLQALSSR
jgi:cell division protein YceG involved in septum cleavage